MPRRKMLSKDRIRALYEAHEPHAAWLPDALTDFEWVRDASDLALREPAALERLWSLTGIGKAGPSENLDTSPLRADSTFVRQLLEVRARGWDTAPTRRALELREAFDHLEARARELLGDKRFPRARLVRIFQAFRPGDFTSNYNDPSHYAMRDFLVGQRGLSRVENHVLARARLRDALGAEGDLEEHARRILFCWWLFEHADAIADGGIPSDGEGPEHPPPNPPTLQLLPISRQYRWLDVYAGGLSTVRAVLRECLDSQAVELLADTLEDELEASVSNFHKYMLQLTRDLSRLDLLHREGDNVTTTEAGESVLDDPQVDRLAESLVARIEGVAWVVRLLGEHPRSSAELATHGALFGTAKSTRERLDRILWWLRLCGLAEWASWTGQGTACRLTASGRAMLARLPATLEKPHVDDVPVSAPDPVLDEVGTVLQPQPDFESLVHRFESLASSQGLVFDRAQLLGVHAAWAGLDARKRFVILSGLSGTGKTQLLVQYARAVCEHMGLAVEDHLAVVAVRPDWRDPTGLIGYLNALHAVPRFHVEPALALILRAAERPHLPYFLVLDEMNLAPVERYFAPFLSAMEVADVPVELHAEPGSVNGVPPRLDGWPTNIRVGGTVNMDESTHAFSDKVLDRAFTLEFWDVDLPRFLGVRQPSGATDAQVGELLLVLQEPLRRIRRHIGYRAANEVLNWVARAHRHDPTSPVDGLVDQAVFSKVLPKLRGSESPALEAALGDLQRLCDERGLARCAAKLGSMRERLLATGVTSFWS